MVSFSKEIKKKKRFLILLTFPAEEEETGAGEGDAAET